jgi:hypothetical protein
MTDAAQGPRAAQFATERSLEPSTTAFGLARPTRQQPRLVGAVQAVALLRETTVRSSTGESVDGVPGRATDFRLQEVQQRGEWCSMSAGALPTQAAMALLPGTKSLCCFSVSSVCHVCVCTHTFAALCGHTCHAPCMHP